MNSVAVILVALAAFVFGYIFYARKIESVFGIDPDRLTPAHTKTD
ncbi:MAG TPA: carbon starvation CstA family protein, partial [Candidatus Omnitrophota bacterium]|nr:carbon starvation CstA family protein [Candidatus Omnitrophota bacterium]